MLFNIDINKDGYGLGNTTKQMTNDIGKLVVYRENDSKKEKYLDDINIGDLMFFHDANIKDTSPLPTNNYPGHVGIYIGDKEFIHASEEMGKITIDKLEDHWLGKLVGTRDILSNIIKF